MGDANGEDLCGICCDESVTELLEAGQLAALDCCVHRFGCSCILRWVQTASCCPLCNAEVSCISRHNRDGELERIAVQHKAREPLHIKKDRDALERGRSGSVDVVRYCQGVCGSAHAAVAPSDEPSRAAASTAALMWQASAAAKACA